MAELPSDEELLARAEEALSEIKVSTGLSDRHASVLAVLRIRLRGDPGSSLEDLMESAGDLGGPQLDDLMTREQKKGSLDDLLAKPKPKREWPS